MAIVPGCRPGLAAVSAVVVAAAFALSAALPAAAQTLERIGTAGVMKVGVREDARPFSFLDAAGAAEGYTVALCRALAEDVKSQLGLTELSIEYLPLSTEERFRAVAEGRVDIHCGASTVTLERRKTVAFSIPTFHTGIGTVMRADAPAFLRDTLSKRRPTLPARVALLQAFADRAFGVRVSTTTETWLREAIRDLASNAEIVTLDSHDDGLRRVLSGELDAYFADRAILLGLVAASDDPAAFEVGARSYTHEPYALALSKGDEDFRLLVDRSLSRLYSSGEIAPIFNRYFGRLSRSALQLFVMTAIPE